MTPTTFHYWICYLCSFEADLRSISTSMWVLCALFFSLVVLTAFKPTK